MELNYWPGHIICFDHHYYGIYHQPVYKRVYPSIIISILVLMNPSCLQATWASEVSHISLHTVPQALLLQISTRPSKKVPPCSLMSPVVQVVPAHTTPASWLWLQLCIPRPPLRHSINLSSVPLHSISSSQISPVPSITSSPYSGVAAANSYKLNWLKLHRM